MPDTYTLQLDNSGQSRLNVTVPNGKRVYLSRAPQVKRGTMDVHDFQSGITYEVPDGVSVYDTQIVGRKASLAFLATSNDSITSVTVDVRSPQ